MDRGEPSSDSCLVCEGLDELVKQLSSNGVSLYEIREHLLLRADSLNKTLTTSRSVRLREVRLMRGVSQYDLAKRCGVTNYHISKIEHGCERSSADLVRKIATVLGVDQEWLLTGTGAMEVPDFDCSLLDRKPRRKKKAGRLTEDAAKILIHLTERSSSARSEIVEATGLDVNRVSSHLGRLSDLDLAYNVSWGVWAATREGRARIADA